MFRPDVAALGELFVDATVTAFPAIEAKWREIRDRIERYVEGIKATVRAKVRDIIPNTGTDPVNPKAALAQVLRSFASGDENDNQPLLQVIEKLETADNADMADAVASAITGITHSEINRGGLRPCGRLHRGSLVNSETAGRAASNRRISGNATIR